MSYMSRGAKGVALVGSLVFFSSAAFAQTTTLTLLTAEQDATVMPVIEAFEKLHPEYDVVHETVPFDSMNATVEARIGGQDPGIDVLFVDSPRVPAMAARGYLMNLNDLSDKIASVTDERARSVLKYKDDFYALPLWNSTQLMFYNKDLLDKAGIPYPGINKEDRLTYDQIVDLSKKAQAAGAKYGFLFEQIDRYYQLQPLFESIGGGSGLTGEDGLTADITNEKWIKAAEFYSKLFADGISPRGVPVDQMASVFTSGDVAFYVGGPWQFAGFSAAEGLKYGIAPVPYFAEGNPVTPTDSWAIGINPHTDQLEGAKLLAEFLTLDPDGAYLTVANLPIPPVNSEAYKPYIDRIAGLDPEIGPAAKVIMTYELAETAVSRPRSIGFVAFEEIMNKAFSDIRNGADVKSTLEQAQAQLKSTLGRL